MKEKNIPLESIVSKVAALGVPGLILVITMSATGLVGAPAITAALAAIGPGGMVGGIITLGVVGLVAEGLSAYGVDAILTGVVKELYKNGESKDSIRNKIKKYPVSKKLKLKLYDVLDRA